MNWKSVNNGKYLATIDVSAMAPDKHFQSGTVLVLNDTIDIDTVLDIADNIMDVLPDFCATSNECEIQFKKYTKDRMQLTLTDENWTQEDWDYFRYDLAMALATIVRNDKIRVYNNKVARNQAMVTVIEMENYILRESGNPDAHLVAKTGYTTTPKQEVVKPSGAADGFMNLPE